MVEINLEDPIVKGFLFYAGVLVIKVLLMVLLTARQRFTKKVSKFSSCTFIFILHTEMVIFSCLQYLFF